MATPGAGAGTGTGLEWTENSFKGHGLAVLRARGASPARGATTCAFTHLTATFPLKLLSPSTSSRDALARSIRSGNSSSGKSDANGSSQTPKAIAALYVVGYGGGLVSGDTVSLDIDVGSRCTLLLLTQGSTKVFKQRPSRERSARRGTVASNGLTYGSDAGTSQTFRLLVRKSATLVVLPDPVTCFKRAKYDQTQRFDLRCADTSSLILLDWFTPGRTHYHSSSTHRGPEERAGKPQRDEKEEEEWAFDRYMSRNEVRVAGHVLARDIVLLERPKATAGEHGLEEGDEVNNPIARRCRPYRCYATLLLVGPDCASTRVMLLEKYSQISQRVNRGSRAQVDEVVWSCSALEESGSSNNKSDQSGTNALIVRVAGITTEGVRSWLRDHLTALQSVVGDDLYRQALGP